MNRHIKFSGHNFKLLLFVVVFCFLVLFFAAANKASAAAPNCSGGTVYLGDADWVSASNGYGPAERNMSNGESEASDGYTITLNGVTYAKGLGVHADSEIIYNISQCSTFVADVGIDDEVDDCGSYVGSGTFEVWADGSELYDSGYMTSADSARHVNLDVSGKSTLRLVMTSGGDGYACDHGDWADANLYNQGEPPTLFVDLKVSTNGSNWQDSISGTAPLNGTDFRATVSGTALGTILYSYDCTNDGSWDYNPPATNDNPQTVIDICNYSSAGTYTARVRVQRDSADWAYDSVTVNVSGGGPVNITIRALGTVGDETIDLKVGPNLVSTWTLSTSWQDYAASYSVNAGDSVTVNFTNDNGPRDVQVDYAIIGGVTYQAEDQPTNTGAWNSGTGSCGGVQSEWLHCDGYIAFVVSGVPPDPYREICMDEGIVDPNTSTLSNWVISVSPVNGSYCSSAGCADLNYCNYPGVYYTEEGGSLTVKTPSLPLAGQYQFTFNYNVGSPGQDTEDLVLDIGGQTFTFLDADLKNTEHWEEETVTVNLNAGVNYFTFHAKDADSHSVLLEAFKLTPVSGGACSSSANVSGWAWSSNIGWISFNCSTGGGADYGVNIDSVTGDLSGYTWSDNIGWLSFNRADANNPPSAPYNGGSGPIAKFDTATGLITGWMRVLSACGTLPCPSSLAGPRAGGWDGWIKLCDGSTSNCSGADQIVKVVDNAWRGWSWTDLVAGWISFNCLTGGNCATSDYKVIFSSPFSVLNLSDNITADFFCYHSPEEIILSWDLNPASTVQAKYEIQVVKGSQIFDKTYTSASQSITAYIINQDAEAAGLGNHFIWFNPDGQNDQNYTWRIKAWDESVIESAWSEWANFTIVPPLPDSTITPSSLNPSAGTIVTLRNNPGVPNASWLWSIDPPFSYENSTGPTSQNPEVTFGQRGLYSVTVTVTDTDTNRSCTGNTLLNVNFSLPNWKEIAP